MKVADLMSSPIHSVSSDRSVRYASDLMNELNVGTLLVVDFGMTVGIVTSKDLHTSHPNRIVADAMTPSPANIPSDQFAWDALDTMERHSLEHLLVVEGEKANVIGIVTREALQIKLGQLIDSLTGLYRAPYIQQIGEHLLHKREYFHLLFIDINNFGEINKTHGHPVGDDILIEFSNRLRAQTNEQDYICRYAGDEFVVITCGNENDSLRLAESLSQISDILSVKVSAAVGVINGNRFPEFLTLSIRELISKASLLSTFRKKQGSAHVRNG